MPLFERASRNEKDERGDVVVKCILYTTKGAVKGNRVKTLRIKNATVTEVHTAIEKALFGDHHERSKEEIR